MTEHTKAPALAAVLWRAGGWAAVSGAAAAACLLALAVWRCAMD